MLRTLVMLSLFIPVAGAGAGEPVAGSIPGGLAANVAATQEFSCRFPVIGMTDLHWLQVRPDGSACMDIAGTGDECDLRLRGDMLLLLSTDRPDRTAKRGDRFRFILEPGFSP